MLKIKISNGMKVKVLYEDSNVLAIDKPAGVLTHPDGRTKEVAITDLLLKKYPKIELVHRLDKDTSGVLLFAKNKKAHEFLKSQFQNRTINKIYHAIVSHREASRYFPLTGRWVYGSRR